MSGCTTPWFAGLTCDHLYADCPNRVRGIPELARWGWDELGGEHIDPHSTDVCGMCRHRHNRSEHETVGPTMMGGGESR